jgi:hypothetical protein
VGRAPDRHATGAPAHLRGRTQQGREDRDDRRGAGAAISRSLGCRSASRPSHPANVRGGSTGVVRVVGRPCRGLPSNGRECGTASLQEGVARGHRRTKARDHRRGTRRIFVQLGIRSRSADGTRRGRKEGLEQGLEQGREQGREQGLVVAVASVLEARDLGPADDVLERLSRSSDQEFLCRAVALASIVESLDELVSALWPTRRSRPRSTPRSTARRR